MLINEIFKKIESLAETDPQRPAIYEDEKTLSYSEFQFRIHTLARSLGELGLSHGDRVGLFVANSIEAYICVYACSLLGLTYIPLAIDDPAKRNLTVICLAQIKSILTTAAEVQRVRKIIETLEGNSSPQIVEVSDRIEYAKFEVRRPSKIPLYMLFTSGSTGTPKGVLIQEDAVENFIRWAFGYLATSGDDIFFGHSRLTFDLSVFNLFLPFYSGGAVRIVKKKMDQIYPGDLLSKNITIALMVPRVTGLLLQAEQLKHNAFPRLRHLLFCGEKLYAAQVNSWIDTHSNLTVHNIYGPTETTVTCTFHKMAAGISVQDPIPIGSVIPNMQLNFLDLQQKIVDGPAEGELIISGVGVSSEDYCGQKTDRFFHHPILGRSFKTGDLVSRDTSGLYFWIARKDYQVKIRGYRVELTEIEAVLSSVNQVLDAVCIHDTENEVLVAFVCTKLTDRAWLESDLKQICENLLPAYMRPQSFHYLEQIPRNANGKADREKLLEIQKSNLLLG